MNALFIVTVAGSGSVTVTLYVPAESDDGTTAVNCVELTKVAPAPVLPKLTMSEELKFVPVIVT